MKLVSVLTYNCEILNQIPDKKIDQLLSGKKCLGNLYFESPAEKLNLHLCRNILGLSKKSSSLAVLGELGQFPIEILCFIKMIKYWHRLKTKLGNKSLIDSFLKLAETDEQKGFINWPSTVKFILQYCNLERVWINPDAISTGKLARQCKKVLQDKFIKFFKDKLSYPISSNVRCNIMNNQELAISRGGNKLRTYNSIKLGFSIEPYLLIIKDKEVRRSISKLRCGNHDLMIETGRYKKQPVEERLCPKCNCVEDEVHFLTECELFSITREKFVKDIRVIDPNFTTDYKYFSH